MDGGPDLLQTIALTMGASWASGVNLYAALLVLGLGGATGNIDLPPELALVQNPLVIGTAGCLYCVEFVADKIPGVDTGWDAIHTFIRIPAGAMLAAGAVGDLSPAMQLAAGLAGGGMAATSHATKAGSRMLINTSPEPMTNWGASIAEDLAVFGGLWAALNHPALFLILLLLFIAFVVWILPKIWRGIKVIARTIGRCLGWVKEDAEVHPPASGDHLERISQLKKLLDEGALTQEEFDREKSRLLDESES